MDYIAFDLETTGLHPEADRIVELAAVRFDRAGNVLAATESLVRPGIPCSPGAARLHGLSDEALDRAPEPSAVLPAFRDFLGDPGGVTLMAHNARFDLGFLRASFLRHGLGPIFHSYLCTLELARTRMPGLPSYKLPLLAERLGLPADDGHRALADADRVRLLWMILNRGN